ncbi:MAG TPA: PQQ-binding-like beta-propeller repeat protein [Solirubrobacteraceae bacterium]|nr:PQQ-binding-like beta-propeller repeat protein [Solirubrobacteraceae bacterium]
MPRFAGRSLRVRRPAGGLACALAASLWLLAGCGGARDGHGSVRSLHQRGTARAAAAPPSGSVHVTAATEDWPEFGAGPQHTGVGRSTLITAANAGALRMRTVTLDGIADSSAIALHAVRVRGRIRDVVVVTTSYGSTIAIDPRTGARLWEYRAPGVNRTPGNPQVTTASPAADPDRRAVYAAVPSGVIVKLALAGGRVLWTRRILLDPAHEKIASALTVSGRYVVAVTGGYFGDAPPYDGHVVTLDRTTGRIAHVWNSECSNRHRLIRASSCPVTNTRGDDAIWGRAGAVIEPGSGRILVATGNGPFNGRTSWGDSVLQLAPDASRLLHNWTPANEAQLSASDTDLGSASPAILPPFHGRRLVVQGGKDGRLHLLDLARLDGTTGRAGPRLGGELGEVPTPGGGELLTAPAVWSHGGAPYLFAATDSGTAAYRLIDPAHPRLSRVWSVSSAGTSPVLAGGLLFVYDELHGALDVRRSLTGSLIHAYPVPTGHWNSPIVSDGRVVLPTGSYHSSAARSRLEILHLPGR